jgi:hypothetical protein
LAKRLSVKDIRTGSHGEHSNSAVSLASKSQKRKKVSLEKNSNPEGVFYRFLRRVCPEGMFKNHVP